MAKNISKNSGRGQRELRVKVKTAKGRRLSSTLWLERQLNDPYVKKAQVEGYRGRAAYKILEIDDKYRFLIPGARVVDLGCAPGGWCQVAVRRTNALGKRKSKSVGTVLGVDLQEMEAIAGAEVHILDFMAEGADIQVKEWLNGKADVVMSDMAVNTTGIKNIDSIQTGELCKEAMFFAKDQLKENGYFISKIFMGGTFNEIVAEGKKYFKEVKVFKPKSSRKDSKESFIICRKIR